MPRFLSASLYLYFDFSSSPDFSAPARQLGKVSLQPALCEEEEEEGCSTNCVCIVRKGDKGWEVAGEFSIDFLTVASFKFFK
jgi:hypothetical protein